MISQQFNPMRRNQRLIRQFVLIALGFPALFFSCENGALYDQYHAIEPISWEKNKAYSFTFEVEDSSHPYDVTLQLRNNNRYLYRDLWLFCSEEPPIGSFKRDTLECLLADQYGKWYGNGISIYESSFPIRTKYTFAHKGQYTFSFKQAMRIESLPGIQEIGLRVVKSNQ